jgi:hypothetical protein
MNLPIKIKILKPKNIEQEKIVSDMFLELLQYSTIMTKEIDEFKELEIFPFDEVDRGKLKHLLNKYPIIGHF